MAETIDVSDDDDQCIQTSLHRKKPTATMSHEPIMTKVSPPNERSDSPATAMGDISPSSSNAPVPSETGHRAYTERFYVDFLVNVEHVFPWKTFATRYGILEKELHHMFFVLVSLP